MLGQALDRLVHASLTCHHAYTLCLSTLYIVPVGSYLKAGFTLRCLQRLSWVLPDWTQWDNGVLILKGLGLEVTLRCVPSASYPIRLHSCPAVPLAWDINWFQEVSRSSPSLGTAPFKYPAPTTDRDRTVSRRSEPSSRTALIGEQPNPWDRIQPQDAMSRHRGCQTSPSMWTLGGDQPVIPRVAFIR